MTAQRAFLPRRRHLALLPALLLAAGVFSSITPVHALVLNVPSDFNGDGYGDLAVSALYEPAPDGTQFVGGVNVLYGSVDGPSTTGDQLFTEDSPGVAGEAKGLDLFGYYLSPGDFNGDGYDDLAIGTLGERVAGAKDAGAVIVIYGAADGLGGTGAHVSEQWTLESPDVPGSAKPGDRMGSQLATGDVNDDGFDELAVGVGQRDVDGRDGAGAVLVLPGSAGGLTGIGSKLWSQVTDGVPGAPGAGGGFGNAVRLGDMDGNGYDDLAVGAPFARVNGGKEAGAVTVLYSTAAGLGTIGSQRWTPESDGVPASSHTLGRFGWYFAIADFGNGAQADLAISSLTDTVSRHLGAGSVTVLYGSGTGLTSTGAQRWTEDSDGVQGTASYYDEFGDSLASGNMGNGAEADLAIGVAYDPVHGVRRAGTMRVLYGSPSGLSSAGAQSWSQDSPGVPERAGVQDQFGFEVFSSDLDGDGFNDVAAGVPYERLVAPRSGAVNVIYGTSAGLSSDGAQLWSQDTPGVAGEAAPYEYFGFSVA